jgi:hypothetical protein
MKKFSPGRRMEKHRYVRMMWARRLVSISWRRAAETALTLRVICSG